MRRRQRENMLMSKEKASFNLESLTLQRLKRTKSDGPALADAKEELRIQKT